MKLWAIVTLEEAGQHCFSDTTLGGKSKCQNLQSSIDLSR